MTELFATGIQMGESPRWHDGRFWMCDWIAGEVLAFDADGNREVVTRVMGLPFSIDWLPDGQLLITTPRGVVVGEQQAHYAAVGQPFNEIVVDTAGRAGGVPGPPEPMRQPAPIVAPSRIAISKSPPQSGQFTISPTTASSGMFMSAPHSWHSCFICFFSPF